MSSSSSPHAGQLASNLQYYSSKVWYGGTPLGFSLRERIRKNLTV